MEAPQMLRRVFSSCRVTKYIVVPNWEIGAGDTCSDQANRRGGTESGNTLRCRIVGGRIAAIIAYSLLAALNLACSREARQDRINRIVQCKSEDVQQVLLLPVESHVPLNTKPVTINDRATIDAICEALNRAFEFLPNHPSIKWEAKVELRSERKKVSFVVLHTEQEENGTIVSIMSHVTSGWNYGSFRCDSLGPILEKLAKTEAEKGKGTK
jgi:hypothetical protein